MASEVYENPSLKLASGVQENLLTKTTDWARCLQKKLLAKTPH